MYPLAYSFRPAASVCSSDAIWSMKEPVPPAQMPFMRCSTLPPSKYMIFASSPPSSMATSVCGAKWRSAAATEMTSCTNGTERRFASASPPDPVITGETRRSPSLFIVFSISDESVSCMFAKCLS